MRQGIEQEDGSKKPWKQLTSVGGGEMVQCFHELTKENRGDLGACATPWWQCLHDLNPTEEMKSSQKCSMIV